MKYRFFLGICTVSSCFALMACGSTTTEPNTADSTDREATNEAEEVAGAQTEAEATNESALGDPATAGPVLEMPLIPKSGSSLTGEAEFKETPEGVEITVEIRDAEPGLHGTHIHQTADCSAEDAKSAGGHFNPVDNPHGLPTEDQHHLGDLGNIEVGEDGTGRLEHFVDKVHLGDKGAMSFRGRALIVHAEPDTGIQPTGGAGARIACAEITQEAAQTAHSTAEHEL